MKILQLILGGALLSCLLLSCDRGVRPDPLEDTPQSPVPPKGQDQEALLTPDLLALKNLGLKPLDIDSAALPPLPLPMDPKGNIGLDSVYTLRKQRWQAYYEATGQVATPGEVRTSDYIIWGYGRPQGILLGRRTLVSEMTRDDDTKHWQGKPYLPLTLRYDMPIAFHTEHSGHYGRGSRAVFDSLTRVHRVVKGAQAIHEDSPMPYDLRHLRIVHDGVDISPLFSIRYQDYKEVMRTGSYDKWYWRDVRISDAGMDVLDWLFGSYFLIYPLTQQYPKFTILFILKDGQIIRREVEHHVSSHPN